MTERTNWTERTVPPTKCTERTAPPTEWTEKTVPPTEWTERKIPAPAPAVEESSSEEETTP